MGGPLFICSAAFIIYEKTEQVLFFLYLQFKYKYRCAFP